MSNISVDKHLYKIFLIVIKFIPTILAILKICTITFSYFKIGTFYLTCVGGTSIIFLLLLYLLSLIFKFCGIHRVSLNYITLITLVTIFDYYIGIPISVKLLYKLYFSITGIFMIIWIVIWYKNRHNPKIDHIKQLCERYIVCCK